MYVMTAPLVPLPTPASFAEMLPSLEKLCTMPTIAHSAVSSSEIETAVHEFSMLECPDRTTSTSKRKRESTTDSFCILRYVIIALYNCLTFFFLINTKIDKRII